MFQNNFPFTGHTNERRAGDGDSNNMRSPSVRDTIWRDRERDGDTAKEWGKDPL